MHRFIGIDPGWSGAIAVVDQDSQPVGVIRFSETPQDVADWIVSLLSEGTPIVAAVIESVASSPQMGVASSFKFGRAAGLAWGLLLANRIRHEFVAPGVWQRAMKCLSGGDKNITKMRAQALWPKIKITHAIADAYLIAEYCRRCNQREG